jgi:phenylalanyl-tRNA synthetase beta chain
MKFTLNWLKEFVEFTGAPEELANLLTMAGLEVESVTAISDGDQLFEIGVTPNRGDCLGIAGIAREVGALTGAGLRKPPTTESKSTSAIRSRVSLTIENPELCARYSARIIDDVQIAPSPAWLRGRLEACGIRAINNVVDVTNYVMLETGQPLHAFDYDRLPHKRIVVRTAKELAKFTTLDGVERALAHDDLLICDANQPVALAGIMGGMDSEVTDSTRSILIESANFAPASIRRTAKRLGLHSEASHRFERAVDPEGTLAAANRAVYLLSQFAGGTALAGSADNYPRRIRPAAIILRQERIEGLLGLKLDSKRVESLLRSIGMATMRQAKSRRLKVTPPTSRPDISREADLIEEIARLHGYDRIPSTSPALKYSGTQTDDLLGSERRLRCFMAGEGLVEAINLPFTPSRINSLFAGLWRVPKPVSVLNPLAKETDELRQSLLPGLIENLKLNLAQRAENFAAYQLGKTFALSSSGEPVERQCVGALFYGIRPCLGLTQNKSRPVDFLDCKGLVEGLLELFRLLSSVGWSVLDAPVLHPGQSAALSLNSEFAGYLGQLHPDICEDLEVPRCWVVELDFEKWLEYAPRRIAVHALPRFPAVERDVAIVVDRDFSAHQVIGWIKSLEEALIEQVEVFDQYEGTSIPEGKKSLAYRVSYRAEDRTLTDTEINALHQSLVDRLGTRFGAEQRG